MQFIKLSLLSILIAVNSIIDANATSQSKIISVEYHQPIKNCMRGWLSRAELDKPYQLFLLMGQIKLDISDSIQKNGEFLYCTQDDLIPLTQPFRVEWKDSSSDSSISSVDVKEVSDSKYNVLYTEENTVREEIRDTQNNLKSLTIRSEK